MKLMSILTLVASMTLSGCAGPAADHTTPSQNDRQSRLQVAEAMLQERCKSAGEKIYRAVEHVEGVFLMKIRPEKTNYSDQYAMTDPYGYDLGGDGYIKSFLRGHDAKGSLTESDAVKNGYHYIEAIDPKDGERYRYTGSVKEVVHFSSLIGGGDGSAFKTKEFVLDRVPAPGSAPRYGVTYDDISTREERDYWIAGSSLRVIDLQSNEVIAERIGYMMDRGQGNTSGGRSPWLLAAYHACPSFPVRSGAPPFKLRETRNFVEKVLRIKQAN